MIQEDYAVLQAPYKIGDLLGKPLILCRLEAVNIDWEDLPKSRTSISRL